MSESASTRLYDAIKGASSVLFTGPMDPDGDSLGACLALARAAGGFSEATVHVAGEANYRYDWMPDSETLLDDGALLEHYDLVVVMDGDRKRLTRRVTDLFAAAKVTALVDHHRSSSRMATTSCSSIRTRRVPVRWWHRCCRTGMSRWTRRWRRTCTRASSSTPAASSTRTRCRRHALAAQLLDLGVQPAPVHAKVLHERTQGGLRLLGEVLGAARFYADGEIVVGVVTEEAVRRLGIQSGDTEGIVDALLNTAGVEVAVLVKESGDSACRMSLRSKTRVNVAEIARTLHEGGGGHVRAAGCRVPTSLDALMTRLPGVLEAAV